MRLGFAVDTAGVAYELALSAAVSEAYDLMRADGVPAQRAADMAVGAERTGRDPVEFARRFVRLRKTVRPSPPGARSSTD